MMISGDNRKLKHISDFGDFYIGIISDKNGKPLDDPFIKIDKNTNEMTGTNPMLYDNFHERFKNGLIK